MKTVLDMFVGVVSSGNSRVPERMQTRPLCESARVCPSDVSVYASDGSPSLRELVSEYLPVPTK